MATPVAAINEYESKIKLLYLQQIEVDRASKHSLKWVVLGGFTMQSPPNEALPLVMLSWFFECDEVKNQGFDGLTGRITVQVNNGTTWTNSAIDCDLTRSVHDVRLNIDIPPFAGPLQALQMRYQFNLIPYSNILPEIHIDPIFEASDKTDAILLVDGMKLHVNKSYLAMHSDFFQSLFMGNFAENSMEEIPIKDVSYQDFHSLLKVVYPRPEFPNDKKCEKLLELADRFLMPGVTDHVEQHLLTNTQLENDRCLWMADRYSLQKLREHCISRIQCSQDLTIIRNSPVFCEYSDFTKARILEKIIDKVEWDEFKRECLDHHHSMIRRSNGVGQIDYKRVRFQ
ncbi:hypothetical protein L5515_007003 [Caenorhabditis briggsae]|uniref:BTB domain-containing protein n=1 Tax=Caenorhabditis briggsae TaxID=6238 RepID=A0AAE9F1Y1_CAEBR|nr:hypothetical protein L5515_007003 [Caenorhabditis briggsae]